MSTNKGQFNVRNVLIAVAVASIGYGIYVQIPDGPAQSYDFEVSTIIESFVGEGNAVYVWIILGLVGLLLLRSLFSKKKEKVASIDLVALIIVIVPTAIVVGFGMIVIAGIADGIADGKVQQQINTTVAIVRGEPLPTVDYAGDECDLEEKLDLLKNTLSRQWVEVTLCKDDEPFSVWVPPGTKPQIEYRDKNDRVLSSRSVSSFIEMENTWGKPGGTPNRYKLSIPNNGKGFDLALRDSVTFLMRAVGNTDSSTGPRTEAKNVRDCSGKYKVLANCKVVVFGENEKLTRSAPEGGCLMADPEKDAKRTSLGGNQWEYVPRHSGAEMRFYEIDKGQTIFGVKCG